MRFMVIVKANKDSEAGAMPSPEMLEKMGKFNEELTKAGVLVDLAGLKPSSQGTRIQFAGGRGTPVDGPFPETKELVAGFWILQVKSREEAVEWVKRAPMLDGDVLEVRPFFELSDFEMTPEAKASHERVGAQLDQRGVRP